MCEIGNNFLLAITLIIYKYDDKLTKEEKLILGEKMQAQLIREEQLNRSPLSAAGIVYGYATNWMSLLFFSYKSYK